MDLDKAIEWAAGESAHEHGLDATAEAVRMRDSLLGFGESKADAVRMGTEDGPMAWPYPDDAPGTVPWWQVAEDHDDAGMTDFHHTPHGVLWLNSQ